MGLLAGINAARRIAGRETIHTPNVTAHGALVAHITGSDPAGFQPSNINFGLIPISNQAIDIRDKKLRRKMTADVALKEWSEYIKTL